MDSRHESLKEGLINHIITIINTYIHSDTDTLVINDVLRQTIHDISSQIYRFLGVRVDITEILSKNNLLSIDTVLLPIITDPESNKILNEVEFAKLIREMKDRVNQINPKDNSLRKNLVKALEEYQAESYRE